MTNSNSNYQIGQATHREYEAQYGQSITIQEITRVRRPRLIQFASLLGSIATASVFLAQWIA